MPTGHDSAADVRAPFLRKVDWAAFVITFLVALTVYVCTLAPSVTLEDSGELVVAADYLGVPHPPGYPIWTLLAWCFQWVFHSASFHGQPNPAWSVGLMSAVFGALAAGLLAALVSRSGYDLLQRLATDRPSPSDRAQRFMAWAGGVAGGLLFAFSPVLWSQSVIVEVYSLNAFFLTLICLLTYWWMSRPDESYLLYLTAFAFGLGFTNHQTLLFVGLGLAVAIACRDLKLFRDCTALALGGLAILVSILALRIDPSGASAEVLQDLQQRQTLYAVTLVVCLATIAGLFLIRRSLMTETRRALPLMGSALAGLSFYLYLPLASMQNPPMNWGYTRTMEGFLHVLGRKQYAPISLSDNLQEFVADPASGFNLFYRVIFSPTDFVSVVWQFTWPMATFVVITFIMCWKAGWRLVSWMLVSLAFFVALTAVFLLFQWPDPDVQSLFIGRVQYIQSHAIYALWIGYGVVLVQMLVQGKMRHVMPMERQVYVVGLVLAVALPALLVHRNFHSADPQYWKYTGGVEQNGHDFGWQFGHYQLRGAQAILEELEPGEPTLPNPDYPPELDEDAIFFGGTDPGRFVPTYMIYSAKVREDVYLITQNALADQTYTNVMRDLYGDDIWIPSSDDSNAAFQSYWQQVQAGRYPGAKVAMKNGRLSVSSVDDVMRINAILARNIFEQNRHKHTFYVEESYPIPWMYPHLVPHGLIMKLNDSPLARLPEEVVENDMQFWAWYSRRLLNDPKFVRDVVARKTFSKLRSSIGGLYRYRGLYDEAEVAFCEAIDLYDLSPEANFRLAMTYVQQNQYAQARDLIAGFLVKDPDNLQVAAYLQQLDALYEKDQQRRALEKALAKGADVQKALDVLTLYAELGMTRRFQKLVRQILATDQLPAQVCRSLAKVCHAARRPDLASEALVAYLDRNPVDSRAWLELAAVQVSGQRLDAALRSLEHAVAAGGSSVVKAIRSDPRFAALQQVAAFQAIVPPAKPVALRY